MKKKFFLIIIFLVFLFTIMLAAFILYCLSQNPTRNTKLREQAVIERVKCLDSCENMQETKDKTSCDMKCFKIYRDFLKKNRVSLF